MRISTIGTVLICIGLIISVIFFSNLVETFFWLLAYWLLLIFIVVIFRMRIHQGIKIITVLVVLFVVILFNGYMQANWFITPRSTPSPIVFRQENNTLLVIEVKQNLTWENFVIIKGNATLPTGTVDLGDIITNCSSSNLYGTIEVEWLPTKTLLHWGQGFPREFPPEY